MADNYWSALGLSAVDNSTELGYMEKANTSLANALESSKAASTSSLAAVGLAQGAVNEVNNLVGQTSSVDKDGNPIKGSGLLGAIEAGQDFELQKFKLEQETKQAHSDYQNSTYQLVLDTQKRKHQDSLDSLGISNINHLEQSLDSKLNEYLQANNSNLNASKAKAYINNPQYIRKALQNKELTDEDAVLLTHLSKSQLGKDVAHINSLRLNDDYNKNGWLTDESMFELAKIRSSDPFARAQGLSTIDLYNLIQQNQRAVRNQGDLTNDMFDLNYITNKNLINGDSGLNIRNANYNLQGSVTNSQPSFSQSRVVSNGTTNTTSSSSALNESNNEPYQSKFLSIGENGENVLTDLGREVFTEAMNSSVAMDKYMQENHKQTDPTLYDRVKDTTKYVSQNPIGQLALLSATLYGGGLALKGVKALAPLAWNAVKKYGAEGTLFAMDTITGFSSGVSKDITTALSEESEAIKKAQKEYLDKVNNISQSSSKEEINQLTKKLGRQPTQEEINKMNNDRIKAQRQSAITEFQSKTKEIRKNSIYSSNQQMRNKLKEKGYTARIDEAVKKKDKKAINSIMKEIQNDKDILEEAKKIEKDLKTKDKLKVKGKRVGGRLGTAGLIALGVLEAAGIGYDIATSNKKDENIPKAQTNYKDLEAYLSEWGKFNVSATEYDEEGHNKIFGNKYQDFGTVDKNKITAGLNPEFVEGLSIFDYNQMREKLKNDFTTGKLSKAKAQQFEQMINVSENMNKARQTEEMLKSERDKLDPNSENSVLNNVTSGLSNSALESGSPEERARYNARVSNMTKSFNLASSSKLGVSDHLTPSALQKHNSITGIPHQEGEPLDIEGMKLTTLKEPKKEHLVEHNFYQPLDGTVLSPAEYTTKSIIASVIDPNSSAGANFMIEFNKNPKIQELIRTIDTHMQGNKKYLAYEAIEELAFEISELAKNTLPETFSSRNGSRKINNKDLGKEFNHTQSNPTNRYNSSAYNNIESAYITRELYRQGKIGIFQMHHIYGNFEKFRKFQKSNNIK